MKLGCGYWIFAVFRPWRWRIMVLEGRDAGLSEFELAFWISFSSNNVVIELISVAKI
jgi:hypothetical protein